LTIEADDAAAGLRILQSGVRIDRLITDVGLPGGINGRQLAEAARAVRIDLKILVVTGYAENAMVARDHLPLGMRVMTNRSPSICLEDRLPALNRPANEADLRVLIHAHIQC